MEDPELELDTWNRRLDELEDEGDAIDRLLTEVELLFSGEEEDAEDGRGQLELFTPSDEEAPLVLHVRQGDGRILRGNWAEVVRQMRDLAGFGHETPGQFMRRMAERWHEQYGVEIPFQDPEGFLRAADRLGLLKIDD